MERLRLHSRLYSRQAIRQAVEAYQHLADITLGREGEYHVVTFEDPDPELAPVLAAELANYALAEVIEGKR